MPHRINSCLVFVFASSLLLLLLGGSQVTKAQSHSTFLPTGTPTRPLQRTPTKTAPLPRPTQTPTAQPKRVITNQQASRSPSSLASDPWIQIANEGFEGIFPAAGWSVIDRSNDGYERYWDDAIYWDGSVYRAHSGSWAAWPARGGADGYFPSSNNNYSNNMDTRMTYGPFDLSNTQYGYIRFWLWREMEECCDWFILEASHTGNDNDFQPVASWTGSSGNIWEEREAWLDNYMGDNSVWLSWRFYSDYSVTYQGPWVDDIEIWKYAPSYVTAQGTFSYYDRDGTTLLPARFMTVYLYDSNPGGVDELLATTIATSGYFQFTPIMNWEADGTNRDLYVVWETTANDGPTGTLRRVLDLGNQPYRYYSFVYMNAPDGTVDFSSFLPPGFLNLEAMWIFQDLRRSWDYVYIQTFTVPGPVTARWQQNANSYLQCTGSCFYGGPGASYIFIAHDNRLSGDTVAHEVGHHYMFNATGWWLWWDVSCYDHSLFSQEDVYCAWSEGWGDFFALGVNSILNANDTCYDFDIGPCTGAPNIRHFNLETHSRNDGNQALFPFGDIVEGRVAGSLYDLFDGTNDGYDQIGVGFPAIWNIIRISPTESTFWDFWNSWKAGGNNQIHSLLAFYQNTIDYGLRWNFLPVIWK